jgi:hypothetical protein
VDLISVISDPKLVLLIQALLWNKVNSKLKQPYILVQFFAFPFFLVLNFLELEAARCYAAGTSEIDFCR